MATDDGPVHGPLDNSVITDWNDDTEAAKSWASPCQAAAAANNGPDPAPAKIRAELISGGNHENSGTMASRSPSQ
ncbi:hypothetical protein LRC484719_44040 [Mycobacterium riyadhense]